MGDSPSQHRQRARPISCWRGDSSRELGRCPQAGDGQSCPREPRSRSQESRDCWGAGRGISVIASKRKRENFQIYTQGNGCHLWVASRRPLVGRGRVWVWMWEGLQTAVRAPCKAVSPSKEWLAPAQPGLVDRRRIEKSWGAPQVTTPHSLMRWLPNWPSGGFNCREGSGGTPE